VVQTQTNSVDWLTLSSNRWTVPRGCYNMYCTAPTYLANDNALVIFNNTTNSPVQKGSMIFSSGSYEGGPMAVTYGQTCIDSSQEFHMDHYTNTAQTNGLGTPVTDGSYGEVCASCIIIKTR
jgi:hypothetical protein